MTQEEVLDFLKRNSRRWFLARDISKGLDSSYNCILTNLRTLRESKIIGFKETGKRKIFMYRYK